VSPASRGRSRSVARQAADPADLSQPHRTDGVRCVIPGGYVPFSTTTARPSCPAAFAGRVLADFKKPWCVLIRPALDRSPGGKTGISSLRAAALRGWTEHKEQKERKETR
jgi:hypothetical protein